MPTKRYSTEQIISKLRQAEVELMFSVNYFGLLATIILAGSGATWTGVESVVMA